MKKEEHTDTLLESMIGKLDGVSDFAGNFDRFLDFCLMFFCANPTKEQLDTFTSLSAERREQYVKCFTMLGELSDNFHDPLGDMFMSKISFGQRGQFFTPECMCNLLVGMGGCNTHGSIYDGACGSGRTLLAGLKKARENGKDPYICGDDLDYRACRMALLNLCLQSAKGDVTHRNTLTLETYHHYHIDQAYVDGRKVSQFFQWKTDEDLPTVNRQRETWFKAMTDNGLIPILSRPPRNDSEPTHNTTEETTEEQPSTREEPQQEEIKKETKGNKQFSLEF